MSFTHSAFFHSFFVHICHYHYHSTSHLHRQETSRKEVAVLPPTEGEWVGGGQQSLFHQTNTSAVLRATLGRYQRDSHLLGLVVKAHALRVADLGLIPAFTMDLLLCWVIPVTQKLVLQWLSCQAPGTIGPALGLVCPVSIDCDWVRKKVWSATVLQHMQLSDHICLWDTLGCCWTLSNQQTKTTNQRDGAECTHGPLHSVSWDTFSCWNWLFFFFYVPRYISGVHHFWGEIFAYVTIL